MDSLGLLCRKIKNGKTIILSRIQDIGESESNIRPEQQDMVCVFSLYSI